MELVINGRDKFVLVLHFHELPDRFILECGFSLLQFLRMFNLLVGNTHQLTERNFLIVFALFGRKHGRLRCLAQLFCRTEETRCASR